MNWVNNAVLDVNIHDLARALFCALDLQEIEFQLGLDWCKRLNLVIISDDTAHH